MSRETFHKTINQSLKLKTIGKKQSNSSLITEGETQRLVVRQGRF